MKQRLHFFMFTLFILLLIVFVSSKSYAQSLVFGTEKSQVEVGFNVGPSFFLGDLGGHHGKGQRFIKDLNLPLTKLMVGVFAAVYPNAWFGIRAAVQTGKLEGADNLIDTKGVDELWRKQRNLDFKTNITEMYVAVEIFPLMLLNKNNPDYKPRLRPYGVLGLGGYHYNPQGSLTDANGKVRWYDLKPLHTEGQGFPEYPKRKNYSLTQVNVPMGTGIKYFLSDRINVSIELLLRKSFTDYIDDISTEYIDPDLFDKYLSPEDAIIARKISDKVYGIVTPALARNEPGVQRGNPHQNDSYFTTFFKVGVRLGPIIESSYKGSSSRNASRKMRCPARF